MDPSLSKFRAEIRSGEILSDSSSFWQTIGYEKNEGFPPLRIKGKKLLKNEVKVQANISSQYISALMLIAPSLHKGLKIYLEGSE